jgi:hypothetical protein
MFYPYFVICVKRRLPPVGKPGSSMRGGKRPKRKTKTSKLANNTQKALRRLKAEQGPEMLLDVYLGGRVPTRRSAVG